MWQPWASYLLHPQHSLPVKRWETRAFHPTRVVKGIKLPIECAIHATLNTSALRDLAFKFPEYIEANKRAGLLHRNAFPLGAIIGVATIVEVVPTMAINSGLQSQKGNAPDKLDSLLGNYSAGRFAWRMAFAQNLREPISLKGRQSVLWVAPPEIEARIRGGLGITTDRAEWGEIMGARV